MMSPEKTQNQETGIETGESKAISREDLNRLPIRSYEGPIRLVNDRSELASCLELLAQEPVLGFDTETRPAFQRGVSYPPALMQLATAKEVFVFQFHALGGLGALRDVLENPSITKAGVALSDDIKQLNDAWQFKPRNFLEIGTMAKELGYQQTGLRSLAGLLLGFRISKREQRSNWARANLTRSQIVYAATDAWVSRELYLHIMKLWGDRPLPAEVDPLTPDPNRKPRPAGHKSRLPRPSRKPGKTQIRNEHTPELPGMIWTEPASGEALAP
jgi:ribonuclease D